MKCLSFQAQIWTSPSCRHISPKHLKWRLRRAKTSFLQFMVSFVPHLKHKLWTKTPFRTPFHKENDIHIYPFENRQWKREQVTFNCMNHIIQFFSANAIQLVIRQLQTIHCYQCLLFSKGDVNKQQSFEHVLGIQIQL